MDFIWREAKQVSCLIQATNSIAKYIWLEQVLLHVCRTTKSLKIVLDRTHTHLCIKEEEGCLLCMRWFTLDVVLPITQFTLRTSFWFSLFFGILKFCMCLFFSFFHFWLFFFFSFTTSNSVCLFSLLIFFLLICTVE
jgi:hypothetical protein